MFRTNFSRSARRFLSLLLAAALLGGLLPVFTPTASAVHWAESYLNQVVEWGVMRGDLEGNLNPDNHITRAEFAAMVNRAFGYGGVGETPFTDVPYDKWYYDDIAIAYNTGYLNGTGDGTTASPEDNLTREQAAVLLARCMVLEETSGEALGFTDSRSFSSWSRGLVASMADAGIITGREDGAFYPQEDITRAEVACMLVKAVGNLIQEVGDYTLGGVYGNLTISSSGTTLRDTIIAGDLYLTAGIDLGDVLLENVTVLGKIVACGAGESQDGNNSITLRNVTADALVVDNMAKKLVSISADGDTVIDLTNVRSHAYIQDITINAAGLKYIVLEGDEGTNLTLAGGISKVTNLTPSSTLTVAQGYAAEITVDEDAVNSLLQIENGAYAGQVNLDVATTVTGTGDISSLTANAAGSTVEMLPDTVTIRPGLTTQVSNTPMDTVAAAQSSADPRLLSNYPTAAEVAPTTATALFSTNKSGTVYWALTALSDGSVDEETLLNPPAYSGRILLSGSVEVEEANSEVTAKLNKLTSGGSYYLSAIFVDSRGQHSPLKVYAFTTPDNSTPNFTSGYPYMSRITRDSGQVAVMTTKSCQLYYALLPKGATAPTPEEFKANAVSGNLGYGTREVTKNIPAIFYVNSQPLEELVSYDLYIWLTDFDGGQSSAVKKVSFTTVDGTPPVFYTEPTVTSIKATSVGLTANLNERGTIYWVVVRQGEAYPKPMSGQSTSPALDSDAAKLQVINGMNALKSGRVNANANRDVTINVSGLTAETAYDLYYIAVDSAGNYGETVKMVTINTLDVNPPTVTQSFSATADAAGKEPMAETDVVLTFNEGIQYETGEILIDLYNGDDSDKRRLAEILEDAIVLYDSSSYPDTVVGDDKAQGHWIDYTNAKITMEDGKTLITFENSSAINLKSGGTYYFQINDIYDTSNNRNRITPNPTELDEFTTVFAQIMLTDAGLSTNPTRTVTNADGSTSTENVRVDMSFQMHPVSTGNVDSSVFYDVFLWSDTLIEFELYARAADNTGNYVTDKDLGMLGATAKNTGVDSTGWICLGTASLTPGNDPVGTSVSRIIDNSTSAPFYQLNTLNDEYTYEFAISLTRIGTLTIPDTWSDEVSIQVTVPAGARTAVENLATSITQSSWKAALNRGLDGGVKAIGSPDDFTVTKQFTDIQTPRFNTPYPMFDAGDAFVDISLQLDRAGTVYWVLAPMATVDPETGKYTYTPSLATTILSGNKEESVLPNSYTITSDTSISYSDVYPPTSGTDIVGCPQLFQPINLDIFSPSFSSTRIKTGVWEFTGGIFEERVGTDKDPLEANTVYYAYFVLKGNSQNLSQVYTFQFTTEDVQTPALKVEEDSPDVHVIPTEESVMYWALYANDSLFSLLKQDFEDYDLDDGVTDWDNDSAYNDWEDLSSVSDPDGFTVLDALVTSISSNDDRSVFDVYANVSARTTVLNHIMGTTTSTGSEYAGHGGPISVGKGDTETIQCKNYMTGTTQYYILVAARNEQGSVYGFKAVGNVRLPDETPPVFQKVSTTLELFATEYTSKDTKETLAETERYDVKQDVWKQPENTSKYAYRGTLTLNFNEPIYLLITDEDSGKRELTTLDTTNFTKHILVSSRFMEVTATYVGASVTLEFTGATEGVTITIFNDGSISDRYSNSTNEGARLVLRFDTSLTAGLTNMASPGFVYEWIKA